MLNGQRLISPSPPTLFSSRSHASLIRRCGRAGRRPAVRGAPAAKFANRDPLVPHGCVQGVSTIISQTPRPPVTLRSPLTPSQMRARGQAASGEGRPRGQIRQPRPPCTPRLCSVRQDSHFTCHHTPGHAPLAPHPEIAISAPAAQKLNVLYPHSKSRPATPASQGRAVAHHGNAHRAPTASLNTPTTPVMLALAVLRFSPFAAQSEPAARS